MTLWSELRSPTAALLYITVALCLVRSRDQPSVELTLHNTTVSVVPGDVALLLLAVAAIRELARTPLPRIAWAAILTGAVFCALVVGTAIGNGQAAVVAAVKVSELAALGLGLLAFLRGPRRVEGLVDVLLLFTTIAGVVGVIKFVTGGGGRQASFLGEHDFAALATLTLLYGLVLFFERRRLSRAALAVVAGSLGCVLGSALASLLGLYLGAALVVVAAAIARRLDVRAVVVTLLALAAVTGGTLSIRAGDLSFLQAWFGKPETRPGEYAASWSQRLIFAYIGGRVFLAHPLFGSGWYPELPPKVFAVYLPDARRRFSDQPPRYFPPPNRDFIPQQTYDQVLYELGIVGGLALLAFLVSVGRACVTAARRGGQLALLPAAWFAAALGAIAGEGLFGGTPLVAIFWIAAGTAVAIAIHTAAE